MAERRLTEDGIETTLAVNHLAPFLLTNLLVARLRAGAPSRVVTVASDAHRGVALDLDDLSAERGYTGWQAYCRSKLANILFNLELARRLDGSGVTANCLHPGVVATGLGRGGPLVIRVFQAVARPFLLDPVRGAETIVYLASSPELEGASGGYYEKCRRVEPSAAARDRVAAERLWRISEQLTGLAPSGSRSDHSEHSDPNR
jgi:NAD(P)-dependent dehydrogenase (short-subunit alcohol dehydrogenase family)